MFSFVSSAGSLSLSEPWEVWASLIMTDNKRLAFSIIQFLHDQLQSGNLSSGAQESLEGELHNRAAHASGFLFK